MDDTAVIDEIVSVLLQEANSDYLGLWKVVWELEEHHGVTDEAEKHRLTLRVIDRLLKEGLEVVDFYRGRGWARWPDQNPEAVLARIEREWDALEHEPNLGDICWFNLPGRTQEVSASNARQAQ